MQTSLQVQFSFFWKVKKKIPQIFFPLKHPYPQPPRPSKRLNTCLLLLLQLLGKMTSPGSLPDIPTGSHAHLCEQAEGGGTPLYTDTNTVVGLSFYSVDFPLQRVCLSHVCQPQQEIKRTEAVGALVRTTGIWQNLCRNHMAATLQLYETLLREKVLFPRNFPHPFQMDWTLLLTDGNNIFWRDCTNTDYIWPYVFSRNGSSLYSIIYFTHPKTGKDNMWYFWYSFAIKTCL